MKTEIYPQIYKLIKEDLSMVLSPEEMESDLEIMVNVPDIKDTVPEQINTLFKNAFNALDYSPAERNKFLKEAYDLWMWFPYYKKPCYTPYYSADLKQIVELCLEVLGPDPNLNWIDTKNIKNMEGLFANQSFNGDISEWDTSHVLYMNNMFYENPTFNCDISTWNTSNVVNMQSMFEHASSFNQNIGNWDVSNVTNMRNMFGYAISFNQDLSNWDVSKVQDMHGMFADSDFDSPINDWDVSHVRNMECMFYKGIFNQPLDKWDVSKVKYMSFMFYGNNKFQQRLDTWKFHPNVQMKCFLNSEAAYEKLVPQINIIR